MRAPQTEETRAEIAASTRETWRDPEIRSARVQKVFDSEARAACADAARRAWGDPEQRAARCKALSDAAKARRAAARMDIEVPHWAAKAGLAAIYLRIARNKDEFEAARYCRKLKQAGASHEHA